MIYSTLVLANSLPYAYCRVKCDGNELGAVLALVESSRKEDFAGAPGGKGGAPLNDNGSCFGAKGDLPARTREIASRARDQLVLAKVDFAHFSSKSRI